MAKSPGEQQKTDAGRIAETGTGKLDQDEPATPEPTHAESVETRRPGEPPLDTAAARERIQAARQAAIDQLRTLGVSPDIDDSAPRAGTGVVLDEGDAAQANERQELSFATRQRLATRINQLTAALERLQHGGYGTCADCGRPIEAARLAAAPESELCLRCQERRERGFRPEAAA